MSVSYETFAKKRQRNLPKLAFRTRHSQKLTKRPSKMSVSYETFAKTDKETFQNERFVRDIRKNGQGKLPKGAFHTRHSQKLTKRPSKMSVLYETFAKTDKETFQNERFVRDIRKNGQRDLPKWAFRARHSQKLTKRPSKMSDSCEAFAKTDKETFQNERFVRDIRKNWQRDLPKWAFRTRHSQKRTRKTSKISVSYETFAKTDKETVQNERFIRDIRKNGQRDLPKWAFLYETFARTDKETFQNERFVRDIRKNWQRDLPNWAFRARHSQKRTRKSPKSLPKWAFRTRHSQKRRLVHSNAPMAQRTFHTFDAHILRRGLATHTA